MKYALIISFALLVGCATPLHSHGEQIAFEAARSLDTVEEYDAFLVKYPKTAWKDNAIYYRDRAALNRAVDSRDIGAIELFIHSYPKSDWLPQAEYYLKYGFGAANQTIESTR